MGSRQVSYEDNKDDIPLRIAKKNPVDGFQFHTPVSEAVPNYSSAQLPYNKMNQKQGVQTTDEDLLYFNTTHANNKQGDDLAPRYRFFLEQARPRESIHSRQSIVRKS